MRSLNVEFTLVKGHFVTLALTLIKVFCFPFRKVLCLAGVLALVTTH